MVVYKMFLVHISWLMDSNLCNNISLMCSMIMYAGRAVPGEDEAAAPRQHPVPEVGAAAGDQTSICWERKGVVPCTESREKITFGMYAITLGMLVALLLGLNMSWSAITAALTLIFLDFKDAHPCLEKVIIYLSVRLSAVN